MARPAEPLGLVVATGVPDSPLVVEETMLPSQLIALREATAMQPEAKLWIAVIEQALRDARARRYNARSWLVHPSEAVGSFRWIIIHLGFDPDAWQDRICKPGALARANHRLRSNAC